MKKMTILTMREMLKSTKRKLRKKVKRDIRVAKEAESSPKDKKKTKMERVTVTILVDQAGQKEEGRNKKSSSFPKNDFFLLPWSVNDQQTRHSYFFVILWEHCKLSCISSITCCLSGQFLEYITFF